MRGFKRNTEDESRIHEIEFKKILLSSLHGMLNGKPLVTQLQRHKGWGLALFFCCLIYIYHGFEVERLFNEKAKLEKEVLDLRFESNTVAADLMFSKKQSEVIRKIREAGLSLKITDEPPYKIYAK